MAKQILFDSDGRQKLTAGMQTLAKAVSSTLGPSGKNVVIDKSFAGPVSTKDGISVSKEIELPDPFENMGAKILNEVASKTNDNVGDGTTTAIVLASSMIEEGRKFVASGVQAQSIRSGMDLAAEAVEDVVLGLAKKVEGYDQIRHVAYISSNSDNQIADLLAEAMESVTNDGVITIEENKGTETYLEVVKGLQFDKGFCSPYFITDPANLNTEYEDAHILFFEKKITAVHELVPLLEKVAPTGKPLVIVAENVEAEALAALVINKLQGVLQVVAVKSPGFGDRRKSLMEDMAILTGGVFISEDIGVGLDQVELEHLGSAKKVVVDKEKTIIIDGAGKQKAIDERLNQINIQMEQTTSTYDKEKFTERKAKLGGGIAVLYIGGHTELEMKERKDRATDALHATRAAAESGVIPGGGTVFVRAIKALGKVKAKGDEAFGVKAVAAALEAPLRKIAENAGYDPGDVLVEVSELKGAKGFNALSGEYSNLVKDGVIDPTDVALTALRNAVSIAGLNLTTDALITDVDEHDVPVVNAVT
ncbi:MAG: chaperonin GroEL [Planctomycetota bacterium]|nr:chaperonin GroEL [Planctomycetota bacterium]MEE3297085.1 chaperonin GroEL [Planctomycetota bacterium]